MRKKYENPRNCATSQKVPNKYNTDSKAANWELWHQQEINEQVGSGEETERESKEGRNISWLDNWK